MVYNKLVRDNIPDIIRKKGGTPLFHTADGTEYVQKLKEKLTEEVQEYFQDQKVEELADILEVLYELGRHHHLSPQQIEIMRNEKAERNGGFSKKIILDAA